MQVINSAVQSSKVDWCVKFKQPVEGGETEGEIKEEKAEDLNGPRITAHALKSNMSCVCFFNHF